MHTTLQDRVTDALRAKILSGELAPGARLRQDELARTFNVSHIPVREALRNLDAEGLVNIQPHRGAVVMPLSALEIEEIVRLRQILEVELLARAIPRFTTQDITRAQKLLYLVRKNTRVSSYAARNWDFHAALYKPADAPLTFAFVQRLHVIGERYMRLEWDFEEVNAQHQQLLDYVKDRKTKPALILLREHIAELAVRIDIDDVPESRDAAL